MKAPVTYVHEFDLLASWRFNRLWNDLAWVRHPGVPRREYYVSASGRPYTYGRGAGERTYESQDPNHAIAKLWVRVQEHAGCSFDAVFLNGYEDGSDHLGWHADDSPEMDDARPIAIVTLGESREIWFREARKDYTSPTFGHESLTLGHGSLCLMAPGMQDTHQHRIPKAGFQPCGPRLSLTFRGMV